MKLKNICLDLFHNKKIYLVLILVLLHNCGKDYKSGIFIKDKYVKYPSYKFIVNDTLIFVNKKDSTNYILKNDSLYLKKENELLKYHKLNLGKISTIQYDRIYISFKNVSDGSFYFNYDMTISSNGQVSAKVYGYEENKELLVRISKPFEDWIYYTLQDFNKYDKFYGTKSADDKPEMIIILKNKNKSKLVYGDLNALPPKIQLLAFVLEAYLKQNFKSKNFTKEINSFPSEDSLRFYSQKTGIGKGRIPPPPVK